MVKRGQGSETCLVSDYDKSQTRSLRL